MTANRRSGSSGDPIQPDNDVNDDGSRRNSSGVFKAAAAEGKREARWSVADQYTHGGFRYRLMRRPLEQAESSPRLTKREEDAITLACAGHTNKSIARAMEVSPSTVGVLLFRAAAKLKAKSRSELLSNYEQFKAAAMLSDAPPSGPDDVEPTVDADDCD